MGTFYDKLNRSWQRQNSLLCVGLDPDLGRMPESLGRDAESLFILNREIIDATAQWACAFKPQAAYYHAVGAEPQLEQTIDYIRNNHPGHVVILDAKRGDIGATARMYAMEAFDRYNADAVTVNPYMGGDTLEPFLEWKDRGVLILCKTSNPGSSDIQDLEPDSIPVYRRIARLASGTWNNNQNVGLVTGATWPAVIGEIRREAADIPFLVPGIGAQGGDLEKVLDSGLDAVGTGLLINASRSIMYAGSGPDFASDAARAAEGLCADINHFRNTLRSAIE